MQGSFTPEQFDSIVHAAGLLVAGVLAYIGLGMKNMLNTVNITLAEIRGDMRTHEKTDDVKHADFERRITALEHGNH